MTSGSLVYVMKQHFTEHTNSSKENPSFVLSDTDNHESHLSTATINLAKE